MHIKSDCEAGLSFLREAQKAFPFAPRPKTSIIKNQSGPNLNIQITGDHYVAAFEIAKVISAARQEAHPFSLFQHIKPHIVVGQTQGLESYARTFRVNGHSHCYAVLGPALMHDMIANLSVACVLTQYRSQLGVTFEELDLAFRLMRARIAGVQSGYGWNGGARVRLPPEYIRTSNSLTLLAEAFIFLHEFAHIASGHLDAGGDDRGQFVDDVLFEPIDRERSCDLIALDALLAAPLSNLAPELRIRGAELALASQFILEVATWWNLPQNYSTALERLASLELSYDPLSNAGRSWQKAKSSWTTRPIDLADLLSQGGDTHFYPTILSDSLRANANLIEFEDSRNQGAFYDAMDLQDRFMRSPSAGHYEAIYRTMFPPSDRRWEDIYVLWPKPDQLTANFERFAAEYVENADEFREVTKTADEYMWASFIGGHTIVNSYVIPRLRKAVEQEQGVNFEIVTSRIKDLVPLECVKSVKAILMQLRARVHGAVIPMRPEISDQIIKICELQNPGA